MTDRELLGAAATALGYIDDARSGSNAHGLHRREGTNEFYFVRPEGWHQWNPLTDDGDEARLEAALPMNVMWLSNCVRVSAICADGSPVAAREEFSAHSDRQSARRRAGVRCAAEVGAAASLASPGSKTA